MALTTLFPCKERREDVQKRGPNLHPVHEPLMSARKGFGAWEGT